MDSLILPGLVTATSLGAYVLGVRRLGLRTGALPAATSRMLECLGLAVVFFAANLALGFGLIVAARTVLRAFVSLYVLNDYVLVVLSLVQALVFAWWQATSRT